MGHVLSGAYTVIGAGLIAVFLVVATPTIYDFWSIEDSEAKPQEMVNFLKNVGLLGAADRELPDRAPRLALRGGCRPLIPMQPARKASSGARPTVSHPAKPSSAAGGSSCGRSATIRPARFRPMPGTAASSSIEAPFGSTG